MENNTQPNPSNAASRAVEEKFDIKIPENHIHSTLKESITCDEYARYIFSSLTAQVRASMPKDESGWYQKGLQDGRASTILEVEDIIPEDEPNSGPYADRGLTARNNALAEVRSLLNKMKGE